MSDALLSEVLRKLLTVHYSLGADLTVNATVALTSEEWDAIWNTLNEIDGGEDNALLSLPEPERG